jgi:hypothetical protein
MDLNAHTDMSKTKTTFITITITKIIALAATLSLSVVANAFAKPSGGDGDSGGGADDDKPKSASHNSGHKKGDSGLPPPGVPVVRSDKKQHDNDGGLSPPGVPAVRTDGDDDGGGYSNNNIKKFDTSKSLFRSSGTSKIIQYKPGFNDTFFNSTLPYCYAVTTGSCYDTNTQQVIP